MDIMFHRRKCKNYFEVKSVTEVHKYYVIYRDFLNHHNGISKKLQWRLREFSSILSRKYLVVGEIFIVAIPQTINWVFYPRMCLRSASQVSERWILVGCPHQINIDVMGLCLRPRLQ